MQVLRIRSCAVLALLFFAIGPTPLLLGQPASLVADLRNEPGKESLRPQGVEAFGENALLQVFEFPSFRSQMWVSDGTGGGTHPIWDVGGEPAFFLGTIGRVIFWRYGLSLWRSDGTQDGTFRLGDSERLEIGRGSDATGPVFAFAGSVLYFAGCTDDLGCEIWRTDGTREGTRIIQDLTPGRDDSKIREIETAGDQVFALLESELRVVEAQGTRRLLSFQQSGVDLWAAARNRLFFRVGPAIWATDGTPEGTRSLTESSFPDASWSMTAASSGLYFMTAGQTWEIWHSDGTPGGTRRILELPEHVGIFRPYDLRSAVEVGDSLLFLAYGKGTGRRLWRLSVQAGTVVPTGSEEVESELFQMGNRVLFAQVGNEGCDVASADAQGTITRLVTGLSCSTFIPYDFSPPVISGGRLYFTGLTPAALQVWRSDGTPTGTDLLFSVRNAGTFRDIAVSATGRRVFVTVDEGVWLWEQSSGARQLLSSGPRTASAEPANLISMGERLFFSACAFQTNLWVSQGTAGSTLPLTSFSAEYCGSSSLIPIAAGTTLFFLDPTHQELWKTDSSGNAPVLLIRDLGLIRNLVAHQGRAFFEVRAGAHSEIWMSDGTPTGTHVAVVLPGDTTISNLYPLSSLSSAGSLLYFPTLSTGLDGSEVNQVWRSDGTPSGTFPLVETSGGKLFVSVGSLVFFRDDWSLWKTDGTPVGTIHSEAEVIGSFYTHVEHAGSLYVLSNDGGRLVLWRTNGTPETTIRLATFSDVHYSFDEASSHLVPFRGRLFFVVDDGLHGNELWATDGTSAGTVLVADISPGPASSIPTNLTAAADALYFSAHTGAHGRELWRSDGTPAGTRRVQDIAPESLSSSPEHLTIAGDHLYFVADDGLTGRELWKLPLHGQGCQPSPTRLCLKNGLFQVEVSWRDFQGRIGRGMASPLTGDTGSFWFFDPANAEVVLKVLDGRGLNGHHWVFYGALSSVEYAITVTDTQTGLARRYLNPSGQLASVGDTQGFGPLGAHSATPEPLVALPSPPALVSARSSPAAATGTCQASNRRLCLNGGRFAVEASWKDFQGNTGKGTAVPLTGDTGWFWFFDSSNVEVMLKVLDGTPLNGKFWVFYGALSNVEYTLTVTDTQTGAVKEYRNPSGRFASVADTGAF